MKASWLVVLAVCVGVGAACDKRSKEQTRRPDASSAKAAPGAQADTGARIVYEKGPKPTPDTPIAEAGTIRITVEDFDRSTRIGTLFAPQDMTEVPPENLAAPHVQMTMTRALLENAIVRRALEERDIELGEKEVTSYLREHERLGRFGRLLGTAELQSALEKRGLREEDLRAAARQELARKKLAEALLAELDDEDVWEAYRREQDQVSVALAAAQNMPTSAEISTFVDEHAEEVERYFQENQNRFRVPKRVVVHLVRPKPGEAVESKTLREAAEQLERGVQPETVAERLGLQAQRDVRMVRGENKKAFGSKPSDVGFVEEGPRGAHAWKVVGFEPSRVPELDRSLRREVAAEILRLERFAPAVAQRLDRAREVLRAYDGGQDEEALARLKAEIEGLGLEFHTARFPHTERGYIPQIGLAEPVVEAAFELGPKQPVSEPIMSRQQGFVVRWLDRDRPNKKEFRANYETYRAQFEKAMRPRVVQQYIDRYLQEHKPSIDVRPLRIKYGMLEKP